MENRAQQLKEIRKRHFQQKDWCKECHKYIPYNKPCEHFEALRKEHLEKTIKDTEEPVDEKKVEASMWSIAQRLQYVVHVKRSVT